MPMYDPNKLLADSQANAILTKDANTIVLTVTECPEVAAGELGSWVTGYYGTTEHGDSFKVYKRSNMFSANKRFNNLLEYYRGIGYVFANEELEAIILDSNIAAVSEADSDYHIRDYPFFD